MTLSLDPEILEAMALTRADGQTRPQWARGDWKAIRSATDPATAAWDRLQPEHPSVRRQDFHIPSFDGTEVLCRWYTPEANPPVAPGPAAVYMHGGGMIMGSAQGSDHYVASYVADSSVPILSVDYRLAPEYPHPTPVEDCCAALAWLGKQGESLGVDPARIAVMGTSAGGGLAAATALLAREKGVPLSKQILLYPMLDDRTTAIDLALVPFALWSYDDNYTGWQALLGDAIGTAEVPSTASPAREDDFSGLPDAYIEVGDLDIFRDECIDYARRLGLSGASVELHVHPGCPHSFDRIAPNAEVVRRAWADRMRVLRSLGA